MKKDALAEDPDFRYTYHERLGLLCGEAEPTREQKQVARAEAVDYVARRDGGEDGV